MATSISPISNSNNVTQQQDTGKGKSILGKDDFMLLMLNQLKYQDPLNPMDSDQYAAQLAQFTQLEQLQNMNDKLEQSITANLALTQSVNNTMAANFIGKDVRLQSSTLNNNGQDKIGIGLDLAGNAKSVTVEIKDSSGKLVKTFELKDQNGGYSKLDWDFTDNSGKKVDQGNYSYTVKAEAYNGSEVAVKSFVVGTIDALRFTESGTKVVIGNLEYNLSDVVEILNPNSGDGENG